MKSSTNRALVAKKQSTSFAQVATNLLNVLQGYTKGIRFVAVLTVLLTMGIGQAWAEGTETFEGLTSESSYGSRSWTGVNEQPWSATLARTDQKISGNRGLTFSNANSSKTITMKLTDAQKAAGIGTFTFKYKHPYSDSGKTNTFSISVNGSNYSSETLSYTSSTATKTITINAVPNSTSITITITGMARLCVDDFSWTSYVSAKPYTVTLVPGPGTCAASVTETSAGAGVTLPTPTLDGCGDWEFAGWKTTSAVTTETTTEPTLIPADAYSPTSDITLYAVYQRTETTEGTPTTTNKEYTHTITEKTWSENGAQTLNSISWTLDNNGSYYGHDGTKGQQVGSGSYPAKSMTLTTSGFASATKITAVRISTSGASSINGTVSVKVGSTAYTSGGYTTKSLTTTNTEYEFTGSSTGNITISWSQTSSKAIYFKTIEVDYQTTTAGGGSTTYYHSTPDCGSTKPTYTLTLGSDLSCVTDGSATVELNATELTDFTPATRDGFTCSGYWSAPSGGVQVLNADGTFAATSVQQYITDGKWINTTATELTPRWECSNTMTLSVGTQSGGTYSLSKTSLETCDCENAKRQVTITATPNSGYSVTDISYSGNGTATKVSGPTVNGENTEWVYQFNQGDNGNGTFTVTFTIIPTYTITWMANGQEFHKQQDATHGTDLAVPSAPDPETYACDDKVFVGWTATPISGTTDDEPADLFTTKTAKVEEAATTFYAVFATAEGAGFSIGQSGTFKIYANVSGTNYYAQGCVNDKKIIATNSVSDASDYTLTYTDGAYTIKQGTNNIGHSSQTELSTDETTWTISEGTKGSWRVSSNIENARALSYSTGASAFKAYATSNITADGTMYYDLEIGGGTTYSDYTTTCVKLPDPVLSFATDPANPIEFTDAVCGGNSSKQSVTVVGENLRDVVEVSVTGPYKIARTSSTVLKDFTTSLTLDKTAAGAIHSNYKTVYIISTPPAQSTEATTGTLTFTTTKGNTLTVNLSTPTVTCTQYTLTLDDRGTKTTAEYYAGASVSKPEDPTGVCTDPIHYVFDGWAEATVTEGSTTYTKVSFPYTMPAKASTLYAVYRYLEGGGNGDYNLVTSALDDWSGDYLIAYSDKIFANGTTSGESGIGAKNNKVDLSSSISNNTIPASVGDQYNVTLEAVTGGYVLKTQDGKYNYHTNNTGNGISASTIGYADDYPITVNFVSQVEINMCLGGSATGSKFRYNTDGYFRFYKNGGQQPVYLYKKADGTTYYTTSPVCGPHLAITEGKEIYVTGGNAGGTRDLVIAQQKVSYKATRLNVGPTSQVPDVKVAANGITVGGEETEDVKVTIDQTKEQQTDGTYTITGTITVQYQPSANNKQEDIQVQLAVDYNAEARDNFTVHARSLPAEFVIVAKSGDKWYALNGDMNTNAANPANGQVTLDNDANPTKATYAPCNTIYTFDGLPNTGDRTYVRFQGTDGAWLWASSGTNVGIQNNVLKTTPEGNNNAYNWKLYTEDNITYRFGNANSSRQLTLSGEKFGMYASGVQDIRILPYDEKCLYNYAPSNLKVSVLKGTYVTLAWDAVIGATKYQYSTNGTTWTDAGTDPTVTINGLTGDNEYTYYIRAYHEDAGVSQECIDYAEITFTTANCDDVPTDITYSADMNSIIVSWIANAATSTVNLYSDEEAEVLVATQSVASPCTFTDLAKNTQYYVQILANGTCASPIVPVKTEDVEVDIVEWYPQGIIVDINTDETVGVTLENEVSYGSGMGTEATELFFSKYYEASYNVKLVAIYNGTKNIIDLTDYTIKYGKTSWESNYITLKDFGATKGQIQPGEEIILYTMQEGSEDDDIMNCVHEDFPDGNWVRVTSSNNDGKGSLSFGGDKTIILCKKEYDDEKDEYYDNIIDVIGALKNDPNEGILPTNEETEKPSWGDKEGWVCETGLSIANDSQIGISTNRCLLIRNNTVTSGDSAVTKNIDDFVTLCTEWKGAHVPDDTIDNGVQASCDNFAYVGTFDYSDYYTKYVPMGSEQVFDENARNADGTVTIPITDLYKHACSNIRVKLTNSNSDVLTDREYKVPIMITTDQETAYTDENKNQNAFYALQQNLATKEVDGEGHVIATHPLSLEEVREICKTCDVVVRDNATLTKVTDGTTNDHPQVHNVYVYEGASIVIPDGVDHNYTINGLSLRRKGDVVASAQVQGTGKFVLPADEPVCLDLRVDANNWHWFTLPYDCDIADVTWIDGTPAKYNTDWFLMYYDGESRAASTNPHDNHWKVYSGTTIEAGKGYIVGITGDLAHPDYTFELRFPMAQEVLTAEQTDKTVPVNAWGVQSDNTPNNLGWNLVGNPYLNYYKTADEYSPLAGLPLIHYIDTDPVTGEWNYENSGSVPYVVTPIDGGWYEYQQELASEVNMMPFTAYFVQVGDSNKHVNGQALDASFLASNRGKKSIVRRAPREVEEIEEPIIVRVELTNSKGESDKTSLVIDDRFTNEYEMNGDFFKWFGDYYNYYTKPVLYTIGADQGKRAFNALNEELAKQPIPMGMYAAQAGNYTFSLNQQFDLSRVEEVWLYDATQSTYTNLMQSDYTFSTSKVNGAGRFSLSVKLAPKVATSIDNVTADKVWATTHTKQVIVNGLENGMHLWLYDATGKLLYNEPTSNYQHTYSVPQTGTYFVSVMKGNAKQTIKVVVE